MKVRLVVDIVAGSRKIEPLDSRERVSLYRDIDWLPALGTPRAGDQVVLPPFPPTPYLAFRVRDVEWHPLLEAPPVVLCCEGIVGPNDLSEVVPLMLGSGWEKSLET